MAVQFVNDPNTAHPKVPSAMARAYNPTECMPLLEDGTRPYTRLVWQWGRVRGDFADQIMGSSADLVDGILQAGRYALSPIIEVMCCTVESAKNLLEMQAWKIAMYRVHRPILHEARFPPWIDSMRATSQSMVRLAGFATSNNASMKGFEPIANGCANLIASMGRIAEDRSMMLDNHPETASDHPTPVLMSSASMNGEHSHPVNGLGLDVNRPVQSGQGSLVSHSHHDYMNTSDRWMAGSAPPGPSGLGLVTHLGSDQAQPSNQGQANIPQAQYDTMHPVNPTNGYPVMIDQILSEAFAYSYNPPAPAAPPPHAHPHPHPHPHPAEAPYNGHAEHSMWPHMGHST